MNNEEERYKVCGYPQHKEVHQDFKTTTVQEPVYCSMSMGTLNTNQDNRTSGNDNLVHENSNRDEKHCNCKCQYFLALFAGMVVLGLAGCVAFLFIETIELKWQTTSSQQTLSSQPTPIQQINQQLSTLHNQTQQLNDSNTRLQQQITTLQSYHVFSCADILKRNSSSPSGYYWIEVEGQPSRRQFCNMTLSCGGVTGGWMRVAELDMTNSSHHCPSGLRQATFSGKRTCGITSDSPSCSSVSYDMNTLGYSKVCGRIRGYQIGSTDAFAFFPRSNPSINDYYVDGVSLTYGNPRQHIWTFASALHSQCSCQDGSSTTPPAFVGNDYFCDTGSVGSHGFRTFHGDDPLWDGAGCGSSNMCCSFNDPPWFYKQLPQSTSDNIEMRVCRDQGRRDEDVAIDKIDIYVL